MDFLEDVKKQIKEYTKKYNENVSSILLKQLEEKQDLKSRKNYEGHITASCYVLSKNEKNILLVFNNYFNMFLQPGGHCESCDDSTISTAFRELKEETGINRSSCELLDSIPIRINTHTAPENIRKNEKEHRHHDFGYLIRLKEEIPINLDVNEVSSFKWVPIQNVEIAPKNFYDRIKSPSS